MSRRLEARKWCPSRSASSTVEDSTTLDMTSIIIGGVDTRTPRSGATALTAADVMTAMRTDWL